MPPKQPSAGSAAAAAAIKDRMRLNVQQVREQQQLNRERRAQDEAEAQRSSQRVARSKAAYAHVQPRVVGAGGGGGGAAEAEAIAEQQAAQRGGGAVDDDVEITVFVRECEPDGGVQRAMESDLLRAIAREAPLASTSLNTPTLPPIRGSSRGAAAAAAGAGAGGARAPSVGPKQQQQQPQRTPMRNVGINGDGAPSQAQAAAVAAGASGAALRKPEAPAGKTLGAVPDYLRQRKAELQAEKDAAARAIEEERERSRHPAGHRLVSEDERVVVLGRLDARKAELERDLARLPMRFDTIAVQRRRAEIEKEMGEVEEAHRRFSVRKQLYVPI
jgi:hypothetical protein